MSHMTSEGLKSVEANRESEEEWRQTVLAIANSSLVPGTKSVSRGPYQYSLLTVQFAVVGQ